MSIANTPRGENSRLTTLVATLIGMTLPLIFLGPAPLAVSAALGLLVILFSTRRSSVAADLREILMSRWGLALLILLLLWMPNVFTSPRPVTSFETALRSFAYLGAAVAVWSFLRTDRVGPGSTLKAFVVASIVLAGTAIVALTAWEDMYLLTHFQSYGPGHIKYAYKATGSAIVTMLPLAALAVWRFRSWWRVSSIILVGMLLWVPFLTFNRAGVAGIVAMVIVTGLCFSMSRRRHGVALAIVALGGILLGSVLAWNAELRDLAGPVETPVAIPDWIIDWHRQEIWAASWQVGDAHRLSGTGINAINHMPGASETIGDSAAIRISAHPHNWLVEIAVETGIPAAIWFLGLLTAVSRLLYRRLKTTDPAPVLAAIAIWTGYWTSGLFNFSYWSSWWMVSFFVAMAIALAVAESPKSETAP